MIALETIPLELTAAGYLVMPAVVARALFPNDVLVLLVRDGDLCLLPTRGPGGGGLLLKQRNRQGDRAVLLTESLRLAGLESLAAGPLQGVWHEPEGMLRVALDRTGSDVR